MPLRLLVYAALYWERTWKKWEETPRPRQAPSLPPIVPIVFHTGDRPWKAGRQMADLLQGPECVQGYAPEWRTLFWDLAERSPQELADAAGAWMRALAVVAAQRESPGEFCGTYVRVLKQLDELAQAVQTTEAQRREVELMSQTLERSWADARFAEGEAKGKAEGKVDASLRTLRVRFGPVPPEIAAIVAAIQSEERLDALLEAAVLCRDLDKFRSRVPLCVASGL
jgi:hypothetical protein